MLLKLTLEDPSRVRRGRNLCLVDRRVSGQLTREWYLLRTPFEARTPPGNAQWKRLEAEAVRLDPREAVATIAHQFSLVELRGSPTAESEPLLKLPVLAKRLEPRSAGGGLRGGDESLDLRELEDARELRDFRAREPADAPCPELALAQAQARAEGARVFLARPAGEAAFSAAACVVARGKAGYLCDMYVRPERRGKGLGRDFLAALECHWASRGLRWLVLVPSPSAVRMRFYERPGYREVGRVESWVLRARR